MISVRGLAHRYGSNEVLRLAEWRVAPGERWLVLGPSGSGKTTLLHLVAGLIRPAEGELEVAGENLRKLDGMRLDRWRGATVGIVLQSLHLLRHLSVRDNLRIAQYLAHAPQDDARIAETLGALGVAGKAARRAAELSEGERQRVAVARAVVNRPQLLLADEPTANLDDRAAAQTVELLLEQAERHGATLVVATHDSRVKRSFERMLDLSA
jgi:putative ABC transport system ATP-binding protein